MIAAFIYDKILGIRVVGLAEIGYGIYFIHTKHIPYGWRGMPPSGYLTGWAAIVVGSAVVLFGAAFTVAPTFVEPIFFSHHG